VLGIIYIGAFQGSRHWGDLYALLFFGLLGWTMKQFKWPRPPLILGIVLGDVIERYMFISVERYGASWLLRPIVAILFAIAIFGLLRPFFQDVKLHGGLKRMLTDFGKPRFHYGDLFYVFLIVLMGWMLIEASQWNFSAKLVPMIVGTMALTFATMSLLNGIFRAEGDALAGLSDKAREEVKKKIHMDVTSDTAHLPIRLVLQRAAIFFGWLIAFMASMATIGLIPTVPIFVIAYMRLEAKEPWILVLPQAIGLTLFIYIVFDQLLTIPWPQTLLGTWFPGMKVIPSV
jgi:hypothetical protein